MATEVVMPQMGESIAEGTITRWMKKVGERVERDEPLFEISTDKVDAEIPSPAAGTLQEVRFKEGDTVEVNTVVAVIGEGDGASAPEAPAKQGATSAAQSAAPASQAAVSAPAPPHPQAQQQPSTPAPQQRAAAPQSQQPATTAPTTGGTSVTEVSGSPRATAGAPPADGTHGARTAEELRRTRSSPLVRKIAAEHGIDISRLEGTGASGRVTKNDILSYIESGAAAQPAPSAAPPAAEGPVMRAPAPARPAPAQPGEGDRVEPMSVM